MSAIGTLEMGSWVMLLVATILHLQSVTVISKNTLVHAFCSIFLSQKMAYLGT